MNTSATSIPRNGGGVQPAGPIGSNNAISETLTGFVET